MKYNELSKLQTTKAKKRSGRGISAGRGKTAGRGTKGQGSRKSGGVRPGFEGGQTPLHMRLPKLRGFRSYRSKPQVVTTGQISNLKKTKIDNDELFNAGLIKSPHSTVKLLHGGDIESPKQVKLQAASQSAIKALAKAGGSFERTPNLKPAKNNSEQAKKAR